MTCIFEKLRIFVHNYLREPNIYDTFVPKKTLTCAYISIVNKNQIVYQQIYITECVNNK